MLQVKERRIPVLDTFMCLLCFVTTEIQRILIINILKGAVKIRSPKRFTYNKFTRSHQSIIHDPVNQN